ncbi:MAG: LamG domain-containing protein [Phycisphaeraceae bacterium]
MRCASTLMVLLLLLATSTVSAELRVLAHYQLDQDVRRVTYVVGPETLRSDGGQDNALQRTDSPSFVPAAPPHRAEGGALQFDGDKDMYSRDEAIFGPSDNFVMEAWALAEQANHAGLRGVVANGSGAQGYVLAQSGNRWIAFVGGVGGFDMGPVEEGVWTHLAIVNEGGNARAYLNGELVREIALSSAVAPQFRIGNAGQPTEGFKGMIHSVRVATFAVGSFNPDADFLLDYPSIRQARVQAIEQRERQLRAIGEQPGVQLVESLSHPRMRKDWLIHQIDEPAEVFLQLAEDGQAGYMMLTNGLISRTFYIGENLACVGYRNLSNEAEYIRAVKPEARIKLDGKWYPVGGLTGQPARSYLLAEWIPDLQAIPTAFQFVGVTTDTPKERYHWQAKFNAVEAPWPPEGLRVTMHYEASPDINAKHRGVSIDVHYEIYEGIPVMAKSFTVHNNTDDSIVVDEFEAEIIAMPQDQIRRIHTESDYSFHLVNHSANDGHAIDSPMAITHDAPSYRAGNTTTHWEVDPEYDTWAHAAAFEDKMQGHIFRNLMISRVPMGPSKRISVGETFDSFHTFQLLQDSDDVDRRSLGVRKMYRTIAPQVTEHLLAASTPSQDPEVLYPLIDHMHELGFERLDISFWPGISHDNLDPAYVKKWREITAYAKERGIITGGYELMVAARSRGADVDVVDPATGKPGSPFGSSVCLASKWSDNYFPKVWEFLDRTGFGSLNPDGPYHGCACASTGHKYHRGLEDSQWAQWEQQVRVFHEVQRRNMWAPAPDWYFLNGQASTGMGYREASANLAREQALLLYRQYIYDGTFFKTPSMGWMTIGLIPTYNADPGAILEPLSENIAWYELHLVQLLASGAQPSFRANRLYDSPETRAMVKKWVDWFEQYREILMSDLIHVRRPDGRDIDVMLHVNPRLPEKGMAIFFNPLNESMTREVTLPLYYTGLTGSAMIREEEGDAVEYRLNDRFEAVLEVTLPPRGFTWYVVE